MKRPCQQVGLIFVLVVSSCVAHINSDFKHAEALWEEYNFENAILFYSKAISSGELTDDELTTSHYNLATFYFLCFRAEDSIRHANEVLNVQPNNSSAMSLRALAADYSGHDEQALADWAKLLELNPKDSSVYNDRSYFYSSRGQLEKAIADMDMYLKLKPNSPEQSWELSRLKGRMALQHWNEKRTQ